MNIDQYEDRDWLKIGGSAFNGNTTQANRPISYIKDRAYVNVVPLSLWCQRNFISRDTGYKLIKLKYLVAFRRHGQWWVSSNPDCFDELTEYLDVDSLLFDGLHDSSG